MTISISAGIPRGVRNSNPLNIKRSNVNWAGKSAVQPDAVFETFDDAHHGIRAGARNLLTYYRRDKLNTVQEIISKWAPASDDNDTAGYITFVAEKMGVRPDDELNLEDPEVLGALVTAMMGMEIGAIPYSLATIKTAVAAAYSAGSPAAPGAPAPAPTAPAPPASPPAPYPPPTPAAPAEKAVPPLIDQPTAAPTNKVTAGSIGAMGGLPVAFIAKVFWDRYVPDQPMPTEIAIAIAAAASSLFSFVAGYYTRNRATAPVPPSA